MQQLQHRRSSHVVPFLFVHVSKTGGETLVTLLRIPKNHETAYNRIASLPSKRPDCWSFSIVRNPFDRLVSWYFHLRRHLLSAREIEKGTSPLGKRAPCYMLSERMGVKMNPAEHRFLAERLPFRHWVVAILNQKELYKYPSWGPCGTQVDMLCDPRDGRLLVDQVYKYEDGYSDNVLPDIFLKLNRPELIPNIQITNNSVQKKHHYSCYYENDNSVIEEVSRYFRADLDIFGYQFENKCYETAL